MQTFFRTIPELSKTFAPNSLFVRVCIVLKLWYVLVANKKFDLEVSVIIPINELKYKVSSYADIVALQEVFLMKEYEWEDIVSPRVIVDLGGHSGDTALYFHLRYPNATIYVAEPQPENFAALQKNFEGIEKVIPVHVAIANHDGEVTLHATEAKNSLGASLRHSKFSTHTLKVSAMTLDTFFRKNNIERADLIKFDIEGAEEYLFSTHPPKYFADAYIGEVHLDLMDSIADIQDFEEKFAEFSVKLEPLDKKGRYILKSVKKQE